MAPNKEQYSRRTFIAGALAVPVLISEISASSSISLPRNVSVNSPDRNVVFKLEAQPKLNYAVTLNKQTAIEQSFPSMLIDGIDVNEEITITKIQSYKVSEKYPWRGVHSEAVDQCNGIKLFIKHNKSKIEYIFEARAYNDGVAYRHIVQGGDQPAAPDETGSITLPKSSTAWYHDFAGHYETVHTKKEISEVKSGEWAAPPLTAKLPNNAGYISIAEAALVDYSGLGLQANGNNGFDIKLGHAQPLNRPFELRYGPDEHKRLSSPAKIAGTITTPWRVIILGKDLNALVNSDIIHNLSPKPDKKLFPKDINTEWVKPGRAVWKFLDGGENTFENMKDFSRWAGELGFEYHVIEGHWSKWSEAQMKELVEYSRQRKVSLMFWKHSKDLRTPETRKAFFELLNRVGVVGTKIDFFDHEAKEVIDLYHTLSKEAAEHKILVNYHGANKPAGESRTWPNEVTREGIRGMEARRLEDRATHDVNLPFTRMLAGHADYTPVVFGERRGNTTWAHQVATAATFTSPLLVYGSHPKTMLENPAVEMIKSIPSVWDETKVMPISEIGELSVLARRSGNTWFLIVLNGAKAKKIQLPLSFLKAATTYDALLVSDQADNPASVKIDKAKQSNKDTLNIDLSVGGGFIAKFTL